MRRPYNPYIERSVLRMFQGGHRRTVLDHFQQHHHSRPFGTNNQSEAMNLPDVVTHQDLRTAAAPLTKSLYRTCLRSVKVIRWGNEWDEKEFERREEEYRQGGRSGGGGILSMAPPPDREDELRSRAEYYASYAREYFIQESDCLDNDPLKRRDIDRFLRYLKKGEKDRRWLLGDMMFPDPYQHVASERQEKVDHFEAMARRYLGEEDGTDDKIVQQASESSTSSLDDDDYFGDDEEPEWLKEMRR